MLRRVPLRRSRPKPWFRAEEDKVTPEVREQVLRRDGMCVAAMMSGGHQCRDRFGMPHAATDTRRLTLDHVHDAATTGKRAPSDPAHLVALCGDANNNGWASAHRAEERAYLRLVTADPSGALRAAVRAWIDKEVGNG